MSAPSHAAQGDPAKRAVDEFGDHTSGLVLPMAAPEAPRADRSLLSAVKNELFDAVRELLPCPTTRPVIGGIDLSKVSTGPGGLFRAYSAPLNSRSALRALTS